VFQNEWDWRGAGHHTGAGTRSPSGPPGQLRADPLFERDHRKIAEIGGSPRLHGIELPIAGEVPFAPFMGYNGATRSRYPGHWWE